MCHMFHLLHNQYYCINRATRNTKGLHQTVVVARYALYLLCKHCIVSAVRSGKAGTPYVYQEDQTDISLIQKAKDMTVYSV